MIMKVVAIITIILGGLVSLGNWGTLYQSWRTKHFVSSVPLVGAILLCLGLLYFDITRPYAWLGLIADYGTIVFICSIPFLAKQFWGTSTFNLAREYIGNSNDKSFRLKLFKKGIFTIESKVDMKKIDINYGACIGFGLTGKWHESNNIITLTDYADNRMVILKKKDDKYLSEETNYPKDKKNPYDCLDAIEFKVIKG